MEARILGLAQDVGGEICGSSSLEPTRNKSPGWDLILSVKRLSQCFEKYLSMVLLSQGYTEHTEETDPYQDQQINPELSQVTKGS